MMSEKYVDPVSKKQPTEKKVSRKHLYIILITISLNIIYLYWRIRYTLPINYGIISLIAGVSLVAVEVMGAIESMVHYYNMYEVKNPPVPDVPLELYPDVDVYIATYTEPTELLYKTINGCKNLDYPDKSKVHIYLCDDGHRPEAKELAESMGINYLDRPDNKGAKAGNLNHAMTKTTSPLILTLDADMIPRRVLLMRLVPHFVDAEIKNKGKEEKDKIKVGFIQSPQTFYNPDLFQYYLFSEKRIPNEQDYFYKDIQVSRNRSNSVIYGGSNTLISRAALNDIGGFYEKSITEDFATGMLLQKKGYICYATNEELASGLSPTDFPDLLQQRIRWARGCIQTGRQMNILFTKGLSLFQRANYWASVWYWYSPIKRLIYIMAPIMFATFGFIVIKTTLPQILLFWLPTYIFSNIAFRMMGQEIRSIKWTAIYETAMFPFMLFPVIQEFFGISLKKFKVTSKDGVDTERSENLIYGLPFLLLILLSVIGISKSIFMIFESGSLVTIVILFWLVVNLFNLVMAMFFVMGRKFHRRSERVEVTADASIKIPTHGNVKCKTIDISEGGVSLYVEQPIFIDDKVDVLIQLITDNYEAEIRARLVHVDDFEEGWKYAFEIASYEESKDEYMQILYDRVHTLPKKLRPSHSIFDDICLNITGRKRPGVYFKRKSVRVNMNENLALATGGFAHVTSFSFKYLVTDSIDLNNLMECVLPKGVHLVCEYVEDLKDGSRLYRVTNINEIYQVPEQLQLVTRWAQKARKLADSQELEEQTYTGKLLINDILGGCDGN